MRETFQYHQQILHDPQHSADVLQMFPRFLDTKGLVGIKNEFEKVVLKYQVYIRWLKQLYFPFNQILQDLSMMFGEEAASRFLQKWNTGFKDKVIQEARNLRETPLLKRHLTSALNEGSDTTDDPGMSSKSNKIQKD